MFYKTVYPCVYRELCYFNHPYIQKPGLSLCIQGTHVPANKEEFIKRFIPVYTGNSIKDKDNIISTAVYPCVYRELSKRSYLFYLNL